MDKIYWAGARISSEENKAHHVSCYTGLDSNILALDYTIMQVDVDKTGFYRVDKALCRIIKTINYV